MNQTTFTPEQIKSARRANIHGFVHFLKESGLAKNDEQAGLLYKRASVIVKAAQNRRAAVYTALNSVLQGEQPPASAPAPAA